MSALLTGFVLNLSSRLIITTSHEKEKQAGERGRREGREEEERGRDRSRGEGGRRRAREARSRRAASVGAEGGEESERLRWRANQLEKEKLELTASHNQEVRACHS